MTDSRITAAFIAACIVLLSLPVAGYASDYRADLFATSDNQMDSLGEDRQAQYAMIVPRSPISGATYQIVCTNSDFTDYWVSYPGYGPEVITRFPYEGLTVNLPSRIAVTAADGITDNVVFVHSIDPFSADIACSVRINDDTGFRIAEYEMLPSASTFPDEGGREFWINTPDTFGMPSSVAIVNPWFVPAEVTYTIDGVATTITLGDDQGVLIEEPALAGMHIESDIGLLVTEGARNYGGIAGPVFTSALPTHQWRQTSVIAPLRDADRAYDVGVMVSERADIQVTWYKPGDTIDEPLRVGAVPGEQYGFIPPDSDYGARVTVSVGTATVNRFVAFSGKPSLQRSIDSEQIVSGEFGGNVCIVPAATCPSADLTLCQQNVRIVSNCREVWTRDLVTDEETLLPDPLVLGEFNSFTYEHDGLSDVAFFSEVGEISCTVDRDGREALVPSFRELDTFPYIDTVQTFGNDLRLVKVSGNADEIEVDFVLVDVDAPYGCGSYRISYGATPELLRDSPRGWSSDSFSWEVSRPLGVRDVTIAREVEIDWPLTRFYSVQLEMP